MAVESQLFEFTLVLYWNCSLSHLCFLEKLIFLLIYGDIIDGKNEVMHKLRKVTATISTSYFVSQTSDRFALSINF